MRKLARWEREESGRQKGSANRDKSRRKVAAAYNEVARARRDYHHEQAVALVCENQVIHVEDLDIVGMVKNRRLARAISEAGWSQFVRIIAEKADRYGRTVPDGVAVAGVEQQRRTGIPAIHGGEHVKCPGRAAGTR